VAAAFRARLDALRARYAARRPVAVFYQIWAQPPEPANLVEGRKTMQALRLCVGAMPPRTARAFLIHDWHGYPTADIYDQLKRSAGHVRPMLFRARRVVRDCMARNWAGCKRRRAPRERAKVTKHKR
jgi:DNA-directed RNA polymerase specialized sigma24 family protein